MRILHLISQHPESTGSGVYLQNIISQATARGHENFLIAGISSGAMPDLSCLPPANCRFVNFGASPLHFTIPGMSDVMPYPSSRFSQLTDEQLALYDKEFSAAVSSAIARFSPDIIHSHHLWLASRAARHAAPHLPMVTSCHSTDLRQLALCPHLRERVIAGCSGINRVLSLSQHQADEILRLHSFTKEQIDIVGGGFDTRLFSLAEKKSAPPVEILYAGKLSFAKGVDLLLRVFAALPDDDLRLHLAGSGSGAEADKCLRLAKTLGSRVTIHGRINQSELGRLMQRCHLFVLPSFYEGLPLVLLEAMACGCRIITTNLACCRELLLGADGNLAAIIELGRMRTIDQPEQREVPLLEERLKRAVVQMTALVREQPTPEKSQIHEITEPYDWQSVFLRIEDSYRNATCEN